jgi:hypothetical protein
MELGTWQRLLVVHISGFILDFSIPSPASLLRHLAGSIDRVLDGLKRTDEQDETSRFSVVFWRRDQKVGHSTPPYECLRRLLEQQQTVP